MSKQEIVTKCLNQGILLSPELLSRIDNENIETVFILAKKRDRLVVSSIEEHGTSINTTKPKQKKKLTPKDFIDYYSKKYEILKDIISKKLDPVSINKVIDLKQASVIGLVSEVTKTTFLIEDITGRIEAKHTLKDKILPNSVLGFRGVVKDKTFFVKDIVYPDIPLGREIPKINLNLLLTTKPTTRKVDVVFVFGKSKDRNTNQIKTNPCSNQITKNNQNVNLLSYKPNKEIDQQAAINLLKNRFIPENTPNEKFLLEEIPDIFWLIQDKQFAENYKGVTIVSGQEVEIDLESREVKF